AASLEGNDNNDDTGFLPDDPAPVSTP
ncbi:MAG: hypothetical protein QOE15_2216, partial [Acidimicrobiaceae bacterium]|nr:hypothetical protein [Acidimicrobiaceae bacterium]